MQDVIDKALGLVTQYNPLSVAKGSLIQADDAVIVRENVVENRRGYESYATDAAQTRALYTYNGKVLAHMGSNLKVDQGDGTFSASVALADETTFGSDLNAKGVLENSNLYLSGTNPRVLMDTSGTAVRSAGLDRPVDPTVTILATASGFLANNYQCAYCVVLKLTDQNGNVRFSYPSGRALARNSSGASQNVSVRIDFPYDPDGEITTSSVFQVYRTEQVSGVSSDTSGTEYKLCYEVKPTGTDITNDYLTFTDSLIDDYLGATVYTAESQEGSASGNSKPPACRDIAIFKDHMFFANYATKYRLYLTLAGTSGIANRTVTINSQTYTFDNAVESATLKKILISATGVVATDIEQTARSMVRVLNRYASSGIRAYYVSSLEGLPGQILIEARTAITAMAGDSTIAALFSPTLPVSPSTSSEATASNDRRPNGLAFSKAQQPEHWPEAQYLLVGAENEDILRVVALRDSLIVITEGGVYRVTGENAQSFSVSAIDQTVRCVSSESVTVLGNQVYMLSNQGIVAVSDNDVQVVSRDIEPELKKLLTYSTISTTTFGAGYESERLYLLAAPTDSTDTAPNRVFCYNTFTRAWTIWKSFGGFCAAVVDPVSDKLYFAKPSDLNVYRERKDFSDTDYADPEYSITITSVSGSVVTFSSSAVPKEGWVIVQGGTGIEIDSVTTNASDYTATLANDAPVAWAAGAAQLFPSVGTTVRFVPWHGGNPALLKQVRAVQFVGDPIGSNCTATKISATFESNFDVEPESVGVSSQGATWGSGPWGEFAWGGVSGSGFPTWVPRNKQYCGYLIIGYEHKRARQKFPCVAVGITFEGVSERVGR